MLFTTVKTDYIKYGSGPVEKCRAEPWGNHAVFEKVYKELCPRVSRSNRAAVGLGDFVYSVVD